jgi:hypothetical protein
LPAAAFQAARRLKTGGSQDWLPHPVQFVTKLAFQIREGEWGLVFLVDLHYVGQQEH